MKFFKRILRSAFLMPFGLVMGVAGADGAGVSGTENQNAQNGDQTQDSGGKEERTFTQTEVNAMMAKEKDQGRKAILKELGVEDVKNAKDALDRYKQFLESQKTDLQKAQDAAAETEKNRKALEDELNATNQKLTALMMGCASEKVEDVCVLARARMNDKTTFEQAMELVKQNYPDLFGSQAQAKGTGSNLNPQSKGGQASSQGYGQRLAARYKSGNKSNPYFNS